MQRVRLKERRQVAEGTVAFHFEKPAKFEFIAGQSMDVALIDPPQTDAKGTLRAFTIASAPHEEDLVIATRMRDTAFKRVLGAMPPGSEVEIDGPFGLLTLHAEASRPAVFLAGGIGITPFRSILLHAVREGLKHRLFLFYANRRPEDAAFLEELQGLERRHSRFTLVATMTRMESSSRAWSGPTGHLDRRSIEAAVGDLGAPIYYVAGPPSLVKEMSGLLAGAGIDRGALRAEEFAGY